MMGLGFSELEKIFVHPCSESLAEKARKRARVEHAEQELKQKRKNRENWRRLDDLLNDLVPAEWDCEAHVSAPGTPMTIPKKGPVEIPDVESWDLSGTREERKVTVEGIVEDMARLPATKWHLGVLRDAVKEFEKRTGVRIY